MFGGRELELTIYCNLGMSRGTADVPFSSGTTTITAADEAPLNGPENPEVVQKVLKVKKKSVMWDSSAVDNEGLGKKKSKSKLLLPRTSHSR
mgnify:CR=1 FL=1